MIYIATGLTINYLDRARPYLDDMARLGSRNNALPVAFCVNDPDTGRPWRGPLPVPTIQTVNVDYSATLRLPKYMLQSGGFTDFAPGNWRDDDVIIFTDADARLQRPFTAHERDLFEGITHGEFLIGRNRPEGGQTLAQEALCLQPHVPTETLAARFPGHESMSCRNTGFVVARLYTWRALLAACKTIWVEVALSFGNAAAVQWMMCYVIQRDNYKLGDLDLTVHAHGHLGLPEGVNKRGEQWFYHEELIAYAHAL